MTVQLAFGGFVVPYVCIQNTRAGHTFKNMVQTWNERDCRIVPNVSAPFRSNSSSPSLVVTPWSYTELLQVQAASQDDGWRSHCPRKAM
jgi:hypothetical protein